MSEAKGLLKTCDRCGETVFLKAIADGGNRWWLYEME